jgi:large subunit ribosomal protein L23
VRSPYEILKRPRITEKGSRMSEGGTPVVVFEVPRDANKTEIKNAVQSVFNVQVVEVRTSIIRGKIKRRGKSVGKRPNWKKAIVKLAEGQEIDFFGGTTA